MQVFLCFYAGQGYLAGNYDRGEMKNSRMIENLAGIFRFLKMGGFLDV